MALGVNSLWWAASLVHGTDEGNVDDFSLTRTVSSIAPQKCRYCKQAPISSKYGRSAYGCGLRPNRALICRSRDMAWLFSYEVSSRPPNERTARDISLATRLHSLGRVEDLHACFKSAANCRSHWCRFWQLPSRQASCLEQAGRKSAPCHV